MNCNILNFVNNKKALFNKKYTYFFIDINSLTVTPFLGIEKYQSDDRINITPLIETLKFYTSMKQVLPNTHFIFAFDGGISMQIKKMYPKYKQNRSSKKTKSIFDGNSGNLYDYNVALICRLMNYFGETVIPSNLICNESDFMIGYLVNSVKEMVPDCNMLVMSHDHDYLMFQDKNVDVIYKYTAPSRAKYYHVQGIECICEIIDFPYLKNIHEFILFKALVGDKSDNIDKPFGLKTVTPVKNYFTDCYLDDIPVTYDNIISYFTKYFKNNDSIVSKFTNEFRRNLFMINVFNEEIISSLDKIKLNDILNDILLPKDKKIEINSIYDLFSDYGLYHTKEDIDQILNFFKQGNYK
jgi:5'-3' exonuclease